MSARDRSLEGDGDMGTDERFEEPADETARRESFETAARQGPDELGRLVDEQIQNLAAEFDDRVVARLKEFGEELSSAIASPDSKKRSGSFVIGAVFGALVFAAGVVLGRDRKSI